MQRKKNPKKNQKKTEAIDIISANLLYLPCVVGIASKSSLVVSRRYFVGLGFFLFFSLGVDCASAFALAFASGCSHGLSDTPLETLVDGW